MRSRLLSIICVLGLGGAFLLGDPVLAYDPRIDFVIDLDSVMIDRVPLSEGQTSSERIIDTQMGKFRLADGAEAFLESLSRIPGAKITFYSHAPSLRNSAILNQIRVGQKSALEVAEGRVFSEDSIYDVTKLPKDESALLQSSVPGFRGTYKKDLKKIQGLDLQRAILIDDQAANSVRDQEKNLLWLTKTFDRPNPADLYIKTFIDRKDIKSLDKVALEIVSDRNRLAYARGVIEAAMTRASQDNIPLPEALWRLQGLDISSTAPRSRKDVTFYRMGAVLLKQADDRYHFSPLLESKGDDNCLLNVVHMLQELKKSN